jgi:hypothetical protein
MEYTVDIITNKSIDPMFIKANEFLIDQNKDKFVGLDIVSKKELIETLWQKHYGGELIKESNYWNKIKFIDNKSMVMFQLRWS